VKPSEERVNVWFDPGALQAWLSGTMGVDVAADRLGAIVLQLAWIAVSLAAALALRSATCAWSDRLLERLDPRLRPPGVMRRLRPLVIVTLWWLLVALGGRVAWFLGDPANGLRIASSLLLAWIGAHLVSSLVRDRLAARVIATIIWAVAALDILGLLPVASAALDSLAITVGTVRLSALGAIKGVLLLAALLWGATAASRAVQVRVSKIDRLTPSVQVLIGNVSKIALVTVAIVVALNAVGIDLTGFAVFSGAIGLGLGFGLQKIVSNLVSGVILLLDKSIKPGDVIEIEKTFGWITSLGARYVSVRGRDGKEYLIPNEDLITHRVTNWTYSSRLVRLDVEFGVAYDTDLRRARQVAIEAAQVPERVLKTPAPVCHVTQFGDNAVALLLRFWIEDATRGVTNVKGDVMLSLLDALKTNGIEIPPPQRQVWVKELPGIPANAWPRRDAAE
jgi:small-conductance mechanosensitive channel